MTLRQRPYRGEQDWQAVASLIQADTHFYHQIDFPWRLCSTSLEDGRNAAVWEDEHGAVRVFAALQFPWLTLDYAVHPSVRTRELETSILAWADARLGQIAAETNDNFPFNVCAYAHDDERIAFLEGLGYTRWENSLIVQSRPLTDLPSPTLADGFTIRPIDREREVEAYVALQRAAFESETMTTVWRSHTFNTPLYDPELDLVAVAPDGRVAGVCIWWYQPALKAAQIEPLAVHPDFQHLGLSQALMAEGYRRAAARGAETARVETYSFSEPALKAYEAAGFHQIAEKYLFYKEYE